jgi:hypothetical protein
MLRERIGQIRIGFATKLKCLGLHCQEEATIGKTEPQQPLNLANRKPKAFN